MLDSVGLPYMQYLNGINNASFIARSLINSAFTARALGGFNNEKPGLGMFTSPIMLEQDGAGERIGESSPFCVQCAIQMLDVIRDVINGPFAVVSPRRLTPQLWNGFKGITEPLSA